jgi:hypothetical protein
MALCGALVGHALGQDAAQERAAIDQRLAAEQAACYQQFAVNACLRGARQRARSAHDALQQRERALAEATRRERSERHRQALWDKQAAAAQGIPPPAAPRPRASAPAPRAPQAGRAARAADARAEERARRSEDAARARQRLQDRQRAAAKRAEALRQRQAERAASGHAAPAPLPDPR